jgi:hypothetical protein
MSEKCVRTTLNNLKELGTVSDSPRSGRPKKTTYYDDKWLYRQVRINPGESEAWKFMQDGAPAHTANSIKTWFHDNGIEVIPWCPRSPDLNPIENIWCWMDSKLVNTRMTTVDELKEAIRQLWLEVPKEMCN